LVEKLVETEKKIMTLIAYDKPVPIEGLGFIPDTVDLKVLVRHACEGGHPFLLFFKWISALAHWH
jgi:hypothetical protein